MNRMTAVDDQGFRGGKMDAIVAAQAETLGRPTRTIKDKIAETVTTALVLGSLAIGYNVVRDSMVKEVAAPAAPASPAPAPAPAHTPHTP